MQQEQQQQQDQQRQHVKQQLPLLDAVSGCGVSDVRTMVSENPISSEGDSINIDPLTNVSRITFASGSVVASSAASASSIYQIESNPTMSLHNESMAHPVTIITSTSAKDNAATQAVLSPSIQTQNGLEINVSSAHPIQSEETVSVAVSVAQYQAKAKLPSTVMISQSRAVQPKTLFIQNLATVGIQKATPTIRTSWKIKGHQPSCVNESGLTEINDGINIAKMSRVEAAKTKARNDSKGASAPESLANEEGDVEVEYVVNQYVIEEIESTATVVINHPPTVRDLLEKVTSNPIVLGLVFLILGITLLCILAEGEISLIWTLSAISMASLIVFSGMKM